MVRNNSLMMEGRHGRHGVFYTVLITSYYTVYTVPCIPYRVSVYHRNEKP